jgi:hypothetical protein
MFHIQRKLKLNNHNNEVSPCIFIYLAELVPSEVPIAVLKEESIVEIKLTCI